MAESLWRRPARIRLSEVLPLAAAEARAPGPIRGSRVASSAGMDADMSSVVVVLSSSSVGIVLEGDMIGRFVASMWEIESSPQLEVVPALALPAKEEAAFKDPTVCRLVPLPPLPCCPPAAPPSKPCCFRICCTSNKVRPTVTTASPLLLLFLLPCDSLLSPKNQE